MLSQKRYASLRGINDDYVNTSQIMLARHQGLYQGILGKNTDDKMTVPKATIHKISPQTPMCQTQDTKSQWDYIQRHFVCCMRTGCPCHTSYINRLTVHLILGLFQFHGCVSCYQICSWSVANNCLVILSAADRNT